MPSNLSHAIRHLNIRCRFLWIEGSSEGREDTHDWLMLTPTHVISLSIGDGQTWSIAVPGNSSYLVVSIKTCSSCLAGNFTRGVSCSSWLICILRAFLWWLIIPVVETWCATSMLCRSLRVSISFKIERLLDSLIRLDEIEVCLNNMTLVDLAKFLLPYDLIVIESALLLIGIQMQFEERFDFVHKCSQRIHVKISRWPVHAFIIAVILVLHCRICSSLDCFCLITIERMSYGVSTNHCF